MKVEYEQAGIGPGESPTQPEPSRAPLSGLATGNNNWFSFPSQAPASSDPASFFLAVAQLLFPDARV